MSLPHTLLLWAEFLVGGCKDLTPVQGKDDLMTTLFSAAVMSKLNLPFSFPDENKKK